jgi:hypothetical protein
VCLFVAQLFQTIHEDEKKRYLYVHGPSNTGKTTYLTKVLIRYFGQDNIGTILGNSSNFKFQDIQNKLLVIMDEFRYKSNDSAELLKLLAGEPLLINKKYAKEHITIVKLMGLILSNSLLLDKDITIQQALLNRLHVVEFKNTFDQKRNNINKQLEDEEAEIIVFCNKMYHACTNKKIQKTIKKNKPQSLTYQNKNSFSFFRFTYLHSSFYNTVISINDQPKSIKYALRDKLFHCNANFSIIDQYNDIHGNVLMSYTTKIEKGVNLYHYEKLLPINGFDQYISYNHVCFLKENTIDKIFERSFITTKLEKAQKMHESLINSNKLEIIELKLNRGYEQFYQCMNQFNDIKHCYQTLYITYGPHAETVINLFCGIYF